MIPVNLTPDQVWRPVTGASGQVALAGMGYEEDGLACPSAIDFTGKRVADLGCNLGYFSFQALDEGAALVHGFDIDPAVIRAANALSQIRNSKARFFCRNILDRPDQTYDIAMLIDTIGKKTVGTGKLTPLLDAVAAWSHAMLVFTVRRSYYVNKDLKTTAAGLAQMYNCPEPWDGRFQVMDYIIQSLSSAWQAHALPPKEVKKPSHAKVTLVFTALAEPGAKGCTPTKTPR